jgi:hypothetical protein
MRNPEFSLGDMVVMSCDCMLVESPLIIVSEPTIFYNYKEYAYWCYSIKFQESHFLKESFIMRFP